MTGAAAGPGRLAVRGRVDRSRTWTFTFDGQAMAGHPGDTLASALLAAGVRVVGRSIHRDRPRGVSAAGVEEPGALVQVTSGAGEPMRKATTVELHDGLRARPLAGKGVLPREPDRSRYDHRYAHCDVLVAGGGPAGLAAALAAGRAGARVVLCDEQPELGGGLLGARARVGDEPALEWVARAAAELAGLPDVRVLPRTTVTGYHDHNLLVAVERRTEHLGDAAPAHVSRQRLWHVRAAQVVLATGAHERPLVFAGNDLPGVMLAGAARTYVNRYAVRPGARAVVATTNDSAYEVARDLLDAGVEVAAIIDARPAGGAPAERLRALGVTLLAGSAVTHGLGDGLLEGVRVHALGRDRRPLGRARELACDLLAVSGGWNPAVHLFSQSGGRPRFDGVQLCYVPGASVQAERSAGAAAGRFQLGPAIAQGAAAGTEAAAAARAAAPPGGLSTDPQQLSASRQTTGGAGGEAAGDGERLWVPPVALWAIPTDDAQEKDRQFVDLQRDATVADVEAAAGTGMRSAEHVKRYTTIGTAADQGKTSGVIANAVLAQLLGRGVDEVGTTTYRPPYEPVTFALMAGRDRGPLLDPARTTPMHAWHVAHGAVFEDVGQWKRPWYYPREGEDMDAAVLRECAAARERVGVLDATTLGKIDIRGPDAGEFLDRVYTNAFSTLAVGKCRYGMMCSADGMVLDDGVSARLADDHYLMTTTTGNAAPVWEWLEEWLQTEWPDLRVWTASVTEQWATVAVVGPRSGDVLAALAPGLDCSAEAFGFMTLREAEVAGLPARVFRISFSGELAFEVNVPSWYGLALWEAVMEAGAPFGITPYGTETMHVLRAEKGFVIVGQDTDGTVTPVDLGLDWIVSKRKSFVGKRSLRRPDTARADRKQLVGLLPLDPAEVLPEGAQLVEAGAALRPPVPMVGHVTSSYRSAALGRSFALALVAGGRERVGQRLLAPLTDRAVEVEVTEPVFYDPEGAVPRSGPRQRTAGTRHDERTLTAEGGPARLAARRRSPLAGMAPRLEAGSRPGVVALREEPFLAKVSLRVVAGAEGEATRRACGETLGLALPARAGEAAGGAARSVLLLGPDEWLAVGGPGEEVALVEALEAAVAGTHASVVDLSANRTVLELSGPMARDVLEGGCRLDLHPRAFSPGSCASTDVARAQVYLHQLDDAPTYRLFVRGSFAGYLAEWLLDAMLEHVAS